jgi:UDPglucose 6-dehydrogenase
VNVAVYGLWHLGCVTAAGLAEAGHHVIGLDPDTEVIAALRSGRAPIHEPCLDELLLRQQATGALSFESGGPDVLSGVDALWVTLDTPIDAADAADVGFVRARLETLADALRPGSLVVVSSQVPVGFTRALAKDWAARSLSFAYSPENLRLGSALESFRNPDRIVVGVVDELAERGMQRLLAPFGRPIEWMSVESAEMTKHALNAFLATSVSFINEISRLCERLGADAREVERGLKTDRRIGTRAYLSPGPSFAGGTLARDLRYLVGFGERHGTGTPLFEGVLESNAFHARWQRDEVLRLLVGEPHPVAAILGLTYKPGTSTLRRSAAVELCHFLHRAGVQVRAHDPAIRELPEGLAPAVELCGSPSEALRGADVAVLATPWPEYRELRAEDVVSAMRRARVVDPGRVLEDVFGGDGRILYLATGRPAGARASGSR